MAKMNFNPFGNPFEFFKNLFKENRMTFVDPVPEPAPGTPEAQPDVPDAAPDGEPVPAATEAERAEQEKTKREEEARQHGKVDRTKAKAKTERELLRERNKNLPLYADKIAKAVREGRIAPETWNPNTAEGLDKVVKDFEMEIGIEPGDVTWMKKELEYAFDPAIWTDPNNKKRQLYQFPEDHLNEIAADRESYFFAYSFFREVKKIALNSAGSLKVVDETLHRGDRDTLFEKATDKITELGSDVMKAVQERDYPKIALYAVAAVAFYKLYDQLSKSSSTHAATLKKFALYGTAAYCALAIFAPDYLKTALGKGTNIDIKGSAYATFDTLLKRDPKAYEKGIRVGLMAKLSNAPVKGLFGAIVPGSANYDQEATARGMIHLDNPAIAHLFDPDLVRAKPPADYAGPFSSKQKLYRETSMQLFATVQGLMTMYNQNMYAKEKKDFKQKYVDTNDEYTLHDVVVLLNAFAPSYKPMLWSQELTLKAREDLTGKGGMFGENEKKEYGIWIQESSPKGANYLTGRFEGFPIVIKLDQTAEGEKYLFYLANDADEGAFPLATYTVGNPDSAGVAIRLLSQSVQTRMDQLLRGVITSGLEGTNGLKFDGAQWKGKITLAGVEKFDIPPTERDVVATVYPDGQAVKVDWVGSKAPIVVDEMAAKECHYGPRVINEVVAQEEFNALNVFLVDNRIRFKDIKESPTDFLLLLPNEMQLTLRYDRGTKKYSVADKTEELRLVQDPMFREAYVQTFSKQNFEKLFKDMEDYVSLMPESHFMYFFEGAAQWFKDPKLDRWVNPDADVFSGSIRDYYTFMVIRTQKMALEESLRSAVYSATSLADIEVQKAIVYDRVSRMKAAYEGMKEAEHSSGRSSWERDEYMLKIIGPLKSAGSVSNEYAYSLKRFEFSIFSELDLRGTDLSTNLHEISAKLFAVYYHFTVRFDKKSLDAYGTPDEKDNADRHIQYFDYVRKGIIDYVRMPLSKDKSPETVPPVERFISDGGIIEYEEWNEKMGNAHPLNAIDNNPPWSNEPKNRDPLQRSELEDELVNKYQAIFTYVNENAPSLKTDVLKQVLAFRIGLEPSGALKANVDRPSWEEAGAVANCKRRSEQISFIEGAGRRFLNEILGRSELWDDPEFMKKIQRKWREWFKL